MTTPNRPIRLEFHCNGHQRRMMLKDWGKDGEWWLFYQHPDGQWVSLRKATEDDVRAILCEMVESYGHRTLTLEEEALQKHGITLDTINTVG